MLNARTLFLRFISNFCIFFTALQILRDFVPIEMGLRSGYFTALLASFGITLLVELLRRKHDAEALK
jgi:hypothetical protein